MEEEVGPEHFRQSENPLGVRDVGEDPALEKLGEEGGALGPAGRKESAALTGESDQELIPALGTNDAGETRFEQAAIKVPEDGGIPEGSKDSISSFESFFPHAFKRLEVGLEKLVEGGGAWVAQDKLRMAISFQTSDDRGRFESQHDGIRRAS